MNLLDNPRLKSSGIAALLFAGISLPQLSQMTEKLGDSVGIELGRMGCPTQLGILAHALLYTLAVGALMIYQTGAKILDGSLWMNALKGGLLYFVIANPQVYKITNTLFERIGFSLSDPDGCPKMTGIAVHALVFGALAYMLMGSA